MSGLCVDVQHLTKRFGDFVAVNDVSFQIARGSIFGFLGPNGAGKSTVIRMLLGILPITAGQGTVLGFNIATQSVLIRSRVGYMSQRFSLYEDLSVLENMTFFAGIFGISSQRARERIRELVGLCRLEGYENALAFNLPGGIRQRLAFAVSLIHDPDIVFLDEPTGAVDPGLRRYFWDIIVSLSQAGKTVMVTTHYMDEVERCDQICFIAQGRLIAQGSPSQLKRNTLKGQMFQLTPTRRLEALEKLKQLPGLQFPFPSGAFLRFLYPTPALPEDLRSELERSGLVQGRIEPVLPNLEDVFIALEAAHSSRGAA